MKVLIIKLSSMGDVLHTLPAVVDAKKNQSNLTVDWLVETAYVDLLEQHPWVDRCMAVNLRAYQGQWLQYVRSPDFHSLKVSIKEKNYDYVIDAQGLMKSAFFSLYAKGARCGYSWRACRESIASLFYQRRFFVSRDQHAVKRSRQLFALALGYSCPDTLPDYGFHRREQESTVHAKRLIFFFGTTWVSKMWPLMHWVELGRFWQEKGYEIHLAWGSEQERSMAQSLAGQIGAGALVTPDLDIMGMCAYLQSISAYVAVDTGFSHMAAAMGIPGVCVMGPTDAKKSKPYGQGQKVVYKSLPCSPCHKRTCRYVKGTADALCMTAVGPKAVSVELLGLLGEASSD